MSINIKKLRDEAYRVWGLNSRKVIFDFPDNNKKQEFVFKLDYANENSSWHRSYSLIPNQDHDPLVRVIIPITVINHYKELSLEKPAWYDIPVELHQQIVAHIESNLLTRPLTRFQRLCNRVLPKKYQYIETVKVEDYVFAVSIYEKEMLLRTL